MESAVTPLDTLPCNIESRLNIHGIRVYTEHMHNATRNESNESGTEPTNTFFLGECGLWHLFSLRGACGTPCVILILVSFNSGSVKIKDTTVKNRIKGEETKIRRVNTSRTVRTHAECFVFDARAEGRLCPCDCVLLSSSATRAYGSC